MRKACLPAPHCHEDSPVLTQCPAGEGCIEEGAPETGHLGVCRSLEGRQLHPSLGPLSPLSGDKVLAVAEPVGQRGAA